MNFSKLLMTTALGLVMSCPILSSAVELKLTSSVERSFAPGVGGFPFTPSISRNGRLVYIVYPINPTSNEPVAELFENIKGTLTSVRKLHFNDAGIDQNFNIIDNGFGSANFNRLTLVSDNNNNKIRIDIFDNSFNRLHHTVFDDYAAGNDDFSGNGGQWSADSQFILMSYLTDADSNHLTSRVRVLDRQGNSLADTTIPGGSFGGNFVQFGDRTFVAITAYNVKPGTDWQFDFDRPNAAPPSRLTVLEFTGTALNVVDSVRLPQAADAPSTIAQENSFAYIGVGTSRAIVDDEVNIFSHNNDKVSFRKNGSEERIFFFDGTNLSLVFDKNVNVSAQAPVLYPSDPLNLLLWNLQAIAGSPGFFNQFEVAPVYPSDPLYTIICKDTLIAAPFFTGVFNEKGKWLLITGSDEDSGKNQDNKTSRVNNINLYKVIF
jgi:hypothetical protein